MQVRNRTILSPVRFAAAAAACLALFAAVSCSKKDEGTDLRLPEDVFGFYLGETKDELFARAAGTVVITRAPDPPLGYRGELYDFSHALNRAREVDHVRCAFFNDRLMEVVVYFRDTTPMNLDWQKLRFEGAYNGAFTAEDPTREMAQKTYRMNAPGMSVTLRRITKKEGIELYIQFLHEELHRRLLEKAAKAEKAGRR